MNARDQLKPWKSIPNRANFENSNATTEVMNTEEPWKQRMRPLADEKWTLDFDWKRLTLSEEKSWELTYLLFNIGQYVRCTAEEAGNQGWAIEKLNNGLRGMSCVLLRH